MKINQINATAHIVAFGKTSITVKDKETNKTVGVINSAERLSGGNNGRKAFDACNALKKKGIDWRLVCMDRIVLCDNQVYLFNDIRYKKTKEERPEIYAFDNDDGRLDKRIQADEEIFEAAKNAGFVVVDYVAARQQDMHAYR